jgi:hypothetical protein
MLTAQLQVLLLCCFVSGQLLASRAPRITMLLLVLVQRCCYTSAVPFFKP